MGYDLVVVEVNDNILHYFASYVFVSVWPLFADRETNGYVGLKNQD